MNVNKKGILTKNDSKELGCQNSGNFSVCYSDQKEESDICKNNVRQ